jgi:prepilin-type N-terminal cleavage/methylation domain-containing protein
MNNQILAKLTRQSKVTGFTLVELLIAMAITGVIITVGGSGLVIILNYNRQAEVKTDLRIELNRALDFMADDLRESNNISTSMPASWTGWTVPAGYSGVLFVTKSPGTPGGSQVAYYLREKLPGATSPVWQGPQIIYRATATNNEGDALVDSIQTGGFPAPTITDSRQVTLSLTGQICTPPTPENICSNPQILRISTTIFARAQ